MENSTSTSTGNDKQHKGAGKLINKATIVFLVIFIATLWGISVIKKEMGLDKSVAENDAPAAQADSDTTGDKVVADAGTSPAAATSGEDTHTAAPLPQSTEQARPEIVSEESAHPAEEVAPEDTAHKGSQPEATEHVAAGAKAQDLPDHEPAATEPATHLPTPEAERALPKHVPVAPPTEDTAHAPAADAHAAAPATVHRAKGVAFVEAVIKPLHYELEERFWQWRPNDILNFSDNVNNFQLGVLEVTRRTAIILAERISRTGSTDSFDPNLENAMNWFMIKADKYWFPSPESKYSDGLEEWRHYLEKLEKGNANFYTRADNLIPLLRAYENLLGSCDENLVKSKEENGEEVSFFQADDYFYYSQGVASTMAIILEAVHHDFIAILKSRHGEDLLHHAIESCRHASHIQPWIITEGSLSGILANHRANMAAPISHARFYLGQLIKTLST